jgi:predicted nuclease of restriction endonuclease-like RecB superfamily
VEKLHLSKIYVKESLYKHMSPHKTMKSPFINLKIVELAIRYNFGNVEQSIFNSINF